MMAIKRNPLIDKFKTFAKVQEKERIKDLPNLMRKEWLKETTGVYIQDLKNIKQQILDKKEKLRINNKLLTINNKINNSNYGDIIKKYDDMVSDIDNFLKDRNYD